MGTYIIRVNVMLSVICSSAHSARVVILTHPDFLHSLGETVHYLLFFII